MEQLSFNQNLPYVQGVASRAGQPSEPRVIGSVTVGAAKWRQHTPVAPQHKTETEQGKGNVTEIILPAGQVENFQLLLPMLTQLNQERRWLAWIDPPQTLVSKWQTMHGIITGEILVLRSSDDYPALELAERALGAGTCHAVVMWTSKLGRGSLESLQAASAKGRSHGVVLRQR
ncbi:MAG: SulA-like leucine-rich domain-containing protein [Marinobacter sp.]|uniref:cell division inhibitor SulA n=1 Tax=Marinobacter sp. TaxID=50741 RepID=UPI0034A08A12